MKTSVKKILTIEIIMLITILTGFFVPYLFEKERYIVFLLLIGVATYFAVGLDFRRYKNEKDTLKTLLICLMLFFIFSYLFGLFIGFNKTIYSFGLTNLANNIAPTTVSLLVCEILRYQFIKKSNKNKLVIVLSIIIFSAIEICVANTYYNLTVQSQLYEFIGLIIICGITKNILLSVMAAKYDYVIPIVYRLVMDLYEFIVPIVPGFGHYFKSVVMIIFPTLLTIIMYRGDGIKINPKPSEVSRPKIGITIVTIILLFIVLLNTGFFKYRTLVIGSDSMKQYIAKGDVVLVRKTSPEEVKELKKGDIIAFNTTSKIVVHRIYKIIEKKDSLYFVTKGDNNNQIDQGIVEPNNLVGKVILRIKKVGLPSIWLDELFQ